MGFIVNHKKLCLIPAQQFLGFDWDTVSGLTSINDVKRLNLSSRASEDGSRHVSPMPGSSDSHRASDVHSFGSPSHLPLLTLSPVDLKAVYRTERDTSRRAPLSTDSLQDLRWIASLESLHCASSIWPLLLEDCEVEVLTDTSDAGWGIYFQQRMHQGL